MTKLIEPAEIEGAVRALIRAERTNLGIEVVVPVAYGDGELTTVVVEPTPDDYAVHDAGFGAMRLSSAGIPMSRHVSQRLREFAKRYRCDFRDGRVFSVASLESLPETVCLVANASRSVADYVYEIRRQAEHDFRNVRPKLMDQWGNAFHGQAETDGDVWWHELPATEPEQPRKRRPLWVCSAAFSLDIGSASE